MEVGGTWQSLGLDCWVSDRVLHEVRDQAVPVLNLGSRRAGVNEARVNLLRQLTTPRAHRHFHKIDSTLRGHWVREIHVLQSIFKDRPAVLIPVHPPMKRSCVRGEVFVDNQPLEQTDYADDLSNPVAHGRVLDHLRAVFAPSDLQMVDKAEELLACLESADSRKVIVGNGRSEEDLIAYARVLISGGSPLLVCGPSPVAEALVRFEKGPGSSAGRGLTPISPKITHPLLIACGSQHSQSRRQIHRLATEGVRLISLPPEEKLQPDRLEKVTWDVMDALIEEGVAVLHTPKQDTDRARALASTRRYAAAFSWVVRLAVTHGAIGTLMSIGGDTSNALLRCADDRAAQCLGLLDVCIPVSRIELGGYETTFITKAGALGSETQLSDLLHKIQSAGS